MARLGGDRREFRRVHRRDGTFRTAHVDAVLAGNRLHVTSLKKLLHGFAVLIDGAHALLHGGIKDLLPRDMFLRGNRRSGNQYGQDNCSKRTCRSHQRSSSRIF